MPSKVKPIMVLKVGLTIMNLRLGKKIKFTIRVVIEIGTPIINR